MLDTHTKAPNFSLMSDNGEMVTLKDFKESFVLLYFYPKDDTPGCTKEACAISQSYEEFEKRNIVVMGINSDSQQSHQKFKIKYNLPFILLCDSEKEVSEIYEAKSIFGIKRISYLIDNNGFILKKYPNVDPATHAQQILDDFDKTVI
jgi:thioredoxin-dependent peroxiredoxin